MRKAGLILVIIMVCCALGCAKQYTPKPFEELGVVARAVQQADNGLTVSAAVLNDNEAEHVFGVDLAKIGVQPVWVEVKNETDQQQFFLTISLDQDYYSVSEVWWKTRYEKDSEASSRMSALFTELHMPNDILPRSTVSGFVFVPIHFGSVRTVNVDILGQVTTSFTFYLPIPGFTADHSLVDLDRTYTPEEFVQCKTLHELKEQIEKLPRCTTDESGKKEGDPLNIVVISPRSIAWKAAIRRGWHETEPITLSSSMKTINAFWAHKEYKTSPFSSLYVFGRPQDLGLQKARETIHERNHLRIWLAPIRYKDQDVWVGAISRDIGVKMTSKTWTLTTHEIDGNVDEARSYLVQDMGYSQTMEALALAKGVGEVPKESPRLNLTDSQWYTDGLRAVLFLSGEDKALDEIRILDW